jgi:hypothetical protein
MYKLLILLLFPVSLFSQTIWFPVPQEYRVAYVRTDSIVYCTIAASSHPIALPLPGSRKVASAYGGFNSIVVAANDGLVYINKNDGTTNWTQFAVDTTGATFDSIAVVNCYADTYSGIKSSDSSLWYWGTDILKIIYSSGAVNMKPLQISPSGMKVKKVVMGGSRVLILTYTGEVWEWKYNQQSITPVQRTTVRPAIDIFNSHLDYAGCIIPDVTGSQTMGYPYVFGTYFSAWGGGGPITNPTSVKTLWGVTVPIKVISVIWNTTHYIDSLGHAYGFGFNVQGEVGNGIEFVNRYTYSNPWSWNFTDGQNFSGTPAQLVGTGWVNLWSNNWFAFFKYAQDSAGNFLSWGRNKAIVLGNGYINLQEQFSPNSMDVTVPTIVTPLTATYQQYNFTYPTTSAGSDQSITTSSTTITESGNPALLIHNGTLHNGIDTLGWAPATYAWTKVSGTGGTITSPTARSTTVTGLTTGTYRFLVTTTDTNNGTDTSSVAVTVTTGSTTYYVSSSMGSDANNGTSSATPWQTTTKVNAQNFNSSDSILFKRGDIFPGQLKCTRSGIAGNPIVYDAYGSGAQPIITGYITLGSWVNNGGGIYSAASPGIKQYARNLQLDGVLQPLARFPNTGYRTYTSSTSTSITDGTLTGTPDYTGSGIIVKSSAFTLDTATVTSQSTTVLNLGSSITYTTAGGNAYFFQRDKRWLDTLGEWVVNSTNDSTYVYFGSGGTGGHTVKIAVIDTLCYVTGSYINFNNLHFQGGNFYNFFAPSGGNIGINACTIDYGFNGISLLTLNNTIIHSSIQYCTSNGVTGAINKLTRHLTMLYDTLKYIGTIPGMGGSGAGGTYEAINNPGDTSVYANLEIDTVGYHGIYFSGDSSVVKHSHINYVCFVKDDGGGIYTWDATTIAYPNPRKIIGNLLENGPGAQGNISPNSVNGIYGDGHSNLVIVDSNTMYNFLGSGFLCHGNNMTFTNNHSYGNKFSQGYVAEFTGNPITGTVIKYNIFASPDSTVPVLSYYTPGTDITTLATADSNYYLSFTGALNPFHTQSTGDPGTYRTFANWKSYLSTDANSSYQTGVLNFKGNPLQTAITYLLNGKYQDVMGNIYYKSVPITALSSSIMFLLVFGQIQLNTGVRIIAQ